jgi:hypothetical protein
LHRLEQNLGAANVTLTFDDVREIADAAAKIEVQGVRLPEGVHSYKRRCSRDLHALPLLARDAGLAEDDGQELGTDVGLVRIGDRED